MRIGIITIHNSPNYGACLQSFALYKYLELQGYEVEVIDLHRPYHEDYIPSKKYKQYKYRFETLKTKVRRIIYYVISERKKNSRKNINSFCKFNVCENIPYKNKFDLFNSNIKLSKTFRGPDEIYKNPPIYDLYVTGSDQVWNPEQPWGLEPYFLTFAKSKKCISYASSIGVESLTRKEIHDFKKWLSHYSYISVRERTAQSILNKVLKRDIDLVSDPTFLLDIDEWRRMAVYPKCTNYILLFTLEMDVKLIDYAKKLAKESGKKLIVLHKNVVESIDFKAVNDAGPKEFLGYISCADLIITDSFHCTLFSIILGKGNLYSYIDSANKRGSRIIDLLNTFNLADHLLDRMLNQTTMELNNNMIDRQTVKNIFLKEQDKSREFIYKAIEKD